MATSTARENTSITPGMRLSDLIDHAEGVQARTYFRYALLRRSQGPQKNQRLLPINLDDAMADATNQNINLVLSPGDSLTIFSESQIRDLPTVQVQGEVRNPGFYVLDHQMRVSDLVYMAGGLKDDAYQGQSELARTQVVNGINTSHSYMDVDLRAALAGSDAQNPVLAPNDQLFVRKASDWHLPWVVQVAARCAARVRTRYIRANGLPSSCSAAADCCPTPICRPRSSSANRSRSFSNRRSIRPVPSSSSRSRSSS